MMSRLAMLLANTNRAKAYVQNLTRTGHPPCRAVLLDDPGAFMAERRAPGLSKAPLVHACQDTGNAFDERMDVAETLRARGIPFTTLATLDVNAPEVVAAVAELPAPYVVYAGPGGAILGPRLLSAGKSFLHAHPGRLPAYRGSTTLYYSLLAEGAVWCSVLLLHAEIDAGPTLFVKKFTYTDPSVNIDHVFDPLVRAATLTAFLDASDPGKPLSPVFSNEKGDTYYIIHPVLKHAAILKAKRERVDGYATVLERNDVSGA